MKTLIRLFAASLLFAASSAMAAIDLVGDDTDLFTTNPNIPSQVPSALIVLDNTSNWSNEAQHWPGADPSCTAISITGDQQGDAEVCALYQTLDLVDEQVNIGLMMFNDNPGGAYVRFPMQQMNTSGKDALKLVLKGINTNNPGDKGPANAKYVDVMNDATRYLNSFAVLYSGAAAAAADSNGYTSSAKTVFKFPSDLNDNACGYAYIIFVANGISNKDDASGIDGVVTLYDDTTVVADKSALNGLTRFQDTWARFLFQYGIKVSAGVYRHVTTYTIDVCYKSCDPDQATLLTSMASVSQGKYFKATSLDEIKKAFANIFAEVQAVNSVFAATTLPVSINVRGTNLNQVYIGVFRPDPALSTRWYGNLKQYKLGVINSTTGQLGLVDATNANAVNLNTGFISNTATSIWSETVATGSGFWKFRNTYPATDVGKDQDSPDGDLVEKGGASQKIRQFFASPDSTSAMTRNIYTCTACTSSDTNGLCTTACTAGSNLNKYLFNDANGDVTSALLGTFAAKSVTKLTGSGSTATAESASHGFGSAGQTVSVVIQGATPSLYNLNPVNATIVDANTFTYSVAPSTIDSTHAYVTFPGYTLVPGTDTVTVSATPSTYNVTNAAITAVVGNINQFSYVLPGTTYPTTAASTYTVTANRRVTSLVYSAGTGLVTATVPSHGYTAANTSSSFPIVITGANETEFNHTGISSIASVTTNSFTYIPTTPPSGGTVSTANATTVSTLPSGFSWQTGNRIIVCSGGPVAATAYPATCTTASGFNQTGGATTGVTAGQTVTVVTADATGNTFSYKFGAVPSTPAGATAGGAGFTATRVFQNDTNSYKPATPVFVGTTLTLSLSNLTKGQIGQLQHTLVGGGLTPDTVTITGMHCTRVSNGQVRNCITGTVGSDPGTYTGVVLTAATTNLVTGTATISFTVGSSFVTGATLDAAATTVWTGTTFSTPIAITTAYDDATKTGPVAASPTVTATGTITAKKVGDLATTPNGSADKVTSVTSQAVATGTITAALFTSADTNERQNLINWVRGQDNKDNENLNSIATDVRASVHGDVLHSRPAVINYNRNSTSSATDDNDVFIFYGANDGMLHAIKGGSLATGGGKEQWAFIPQDFFGKLKRMRDQTPSISSSNPKNYFYDGPIAIYTLDADRNTKLEAGGTDKVHMFVGMRRGGRMMYAFDVTDPLDPKLLWKKGCTAATGTASCDTGYAEMGQTWSQPQLGYLKNWPDKLVMIVAAGYDQPVEDTQPCFVTDWYYKAAAGDTAAVKAKVNVVVPTPMDATKCKAIVADTSLGSVTRTRSMGRGVFIIDASNGTVLYRIGPNVDTSTETGMLVPQMEFSMPGDLAVLRNRDNAGGRTPDIGAESVPAGYMDRIYATDTGGNIWRIDVSAVAPDASTPPAFVVSRLAALASTTYTTGGHQAENYRKLMFNPDVVYTTESDGTKYDAVLVGSGDREHPFDMTVANRFYMIKDKNTASLVTADVDTSSSDLTIRWAAPTVGIITDTRPFVGLGSDSSTAVDLFDVTNNCLQIASACNTGVAAGTGQTQATALAAIKAAKGWKLLYPNTGEKTVATATTAAGTVIFNTNQPKQDTVSGGSGSSSNFCTSDLGTARQYGINYLDATAKNIFSSLPTQYVESGGRDAMFAGGGFLPTPVPVVVQIDGKYYQTVIAGVQTTNPGGLKFQSRLRTYWYRKTD